jgi:hypothetical protein
MIKNTREKIPVKMPFIMISEQMIVVIELYGGYL